MAQTLEQILASRKPVYDPQRALIAQQQAALTPEEQAATAGLETAKTNAFGDITNAANARGVVYSGAPIAEQSRYVGERYLPALANLKSDYSNRRTKLEASLLGINQDEMSSAQQIQAQQQKDEADAAYKAEQLQLQRQKQVAAQQVAATRVAAPKQPSAAQQIQTASSLMAQALKGVAGRDGFVSPQSWAQARSEWMAAGYSAADFNARFRGFANLTYGDTAFRNYQLTK